MGSKIDPRGQNSVDSESIVYSLGNEQPFIQLTSMDSSVCETDWNYRKSTTACHQVYTLIAIQYWHLVQRETKTHRTHTSLLLARIPRSSLYFNNTDTQFKISKSVRVTRRIASTKSVLLDIRKAKTVTFLNSFYSRASRTFKTLPEYLRDNTWSINVFKTNLRKRYLDLTLTVYDPAVPETFKSVCIKCHMTRPLIVLLVKLCC